ncbi:DUF3558 family protein [Saccharothrix sp.]|uniref:DUF3558 family protein n=1 Tax=Saccharothrix sp. TaxID=1873460 RepID=UPI0028122321|nr:DUF3558 family protein [Saccharothrix sp.]
MTGNLAIRSILSIAVVGVALAGCTTKEPGDPSAGATATTTTASKPTTTSEQSGGDALADFDPCAAMNAVAAQFSLTRIEAESRGCGARWGQTTTSVGLKVQPELSIAEAVGASGARFIDTNIGSRKAKKVEAGFTDTSCLIAVEVGPKSRVDFVAEATASVQESCDAATKLATAIEPKLPK